METVMQKIVAIYQILQELWWVPLLWPTILILLGRNEHWRPEEGLAFVPQRPQGRAVTS